VTGEHGSIAIDLVTGEVASDARVAPAPAFANYQRNQMFVDEARHFKDCVAGQATPLIPIEDGIAVLRLALAVKDAMRTGRTVEIA
jgi:predicted dehydrogenase